MVIERKKGFIPKNLRYLLPSSISLNERLLLVSPYLLILPSQYFGSSQVDENSILSARCSFQIFCFAGCTVPPSFVRSLPGPLYIHVVFSTTGSFVSLITII